MKRQQLPRALALCLSALVYGSIAFAQEQRVQLKDLPPAVRATVQEQSKGARLRGLSKELEQGRTIYEAELLVNGHNKDLLIDQSGAIIEIEEQVALNSLPTAVQTTIKQQAGKGRILLVETVTKGSTLEFYEAHIRNGRRATEVKVSADGQLVK